MFHDPARTCRLLALLCLLASCTAGSALVLPPPGPSAASPVAPSPIALTPGEIAVPSDLPDWSTWPVTLDESFRDNRNHWLTGKGETPLMQRELAIGPEVCMLQLMAKKGCFLTSMPGSITISMRRGFYLAADVGVLSDATDAASGIAFLAASHADDGIDTFRFDVGREGFRFGVRAKGEWRPIIDWTRSPFLVPDRSNRVGVLAQGRHFAFFINGRCVDDIEDDTLAMGKIGLVGGLSAPGDEGTFTFDNVELREPEVAR